MGKNRPPKDEVWFTSEDGDAQSALIERARYPQVGPDGNPLTMARILSDAAKLCKGSPPHSFAARLDLANPDCHKIAIALQRAGVDGAAIEYFDSEAADRQSRRARKEKQRTCAHDGRIEMDRRGNWCSLCEKRLTAAEADAANAARTAGRPIRYF